MASPPQAAHSITYFLLHGLQLFEAVKSKKKKGILFFNFDESYNHVREQTQKVSGIEKKSKPAFEVRLIHCHIEETDKADCCYTARYRGSQVRLGGRKKIISIAAHGKDGGG